MAANGVRRLLDQGKTAFGTFIFSTDPAMTELAGSAGFDFVIIDMEHASLDSRDVQNHLRAAEAKGVTGFVRVGTREPQAIARTLDAGAAGIVLPHLGPSDDTRRLAGALRYNPMGSRPTCTGVRATDYSIRPFSEYVQEANEDIWLIGLVEDKETVDDIENVVAVPGLDVVMPGPADLSVSYGVPGDFTHPTVQEAVDRIFTATREHSNAALAMYISDPSEVAQWLAKGARIFVYSIDYKIMAKACRETMERLHTEVGRPVL
jgi:2-keto-3-deoxy-L-rhamnonate aldolase RhmA